MSALAELLTSEQNIARLLNRRSRISLPKGLQIVLDYRDPEAPAVLFGRRAPAWPSGDEIAICRRQIDIAPGADIKRFDRNGYNIIEYSWRTDNGRTTDE